MNNESISVSYEIPAKTLPSFPKESVSYEKDPPDTSAFIYGYISKKGMGVVFYSSLILPRSSSGLRNSLVFGLVVSQHSLTAMNAKVRAKDSKRGNRRRCRGVKSYAPKNIGHM